MKLLLSALLLAITFVLGGCTTFTQPLHSKPIPETQDPITKAKVRVQRALDEGYGVVISLNRVIRDNMKAGVWTKAQGQEYLNASREVREQLDDVRDALRLGQIDLTKPEAQEQAIRLSVQALQRRIAAAARTGG